MPADQALAEADVLTTRSLGRGWRPVPMVNNAERLRPFGDDAASIAVEARWIALTNPRHAFARSKLVHDGGSPSW